MFRKIKQFIKSLRKIRVSGRNNIVKVNCKIKNGFLYVSGSNNKIIIPSSCKFNNAEIHIEGDNNTLLLAEKVRLLGPVKIKMQGNATLELNENCGIRGVDFEVKDGLISIGELCMFSYGITIRNHDSHKVFKINDTTPCNNACDIKLGKHVWICQNASILKGVNIGDDSIVAYGAIVTKGCQSNSILAGNPAKVVKTNIFWDY